MKKVAKNAQGSSVIINERTKKQLIDKIDKQIKNVIFQLAQLQGEKDEESLVRLSELNQQRDRLVYRLEQVQDSVTFDDFGADGSAVSLGNSVSLKSSGKEVKINLVGEFEANPTSGSISCRSPLGSALINRKKGDKVEIETPSGVQYYEIIDIS